MSVQGVQFTEASAKRIANAVRAIERTGVDMRANRLGPRDAGGFSVRGEPALYKVISLREWDGDTIVDIGNETNDVTKLQPTWDWVRAHVTVV